MRPARSSAAPNAFNGRWVEKTSRKQRVRWPRARGRVAQSQSSSAAAATRTRPRRARPAAAAVSPPARVSACSSACSMRASPLSYNRPVIRPPVQSLRPAQWAKNLFVLAPLVFGDLLLNERAALRALLALLAFCCASSAVYLINDLRDREEDRRHPLKRRRPLAAGTLGVPAAVTAVVVLIAAAGALAVYLGRPFGTVLGAYLILNVLYTLWFKHMVILDVMCIGISFVLRVEAGARATGIEVSRWLFLCTTFLALFLAFSKRRHEITLLAH